MKTSLDKFNQELAVARSEKVKAFKANKETWVLDKPTYECLKSLFIAFKNAPVGFAYNDNAEQVLRRREVLQSFGFLDNEGKPVASKAPAFTQFMRVVTATYKGYVNVMWYSYDALCTDLGVTPILPDYTTTDGFDLQEASY